MRVSKGLEDELGTCVSRGREIEGGEGDELGQDLDNQLTSALATCPPSFAPFFPGLATLTSEMALIASRRSSVFPDPIAPL